MNKKQMFLLFWAGTLAGMVFGAISWLFSTSRPSFLIGIMAGILAVWILVVLIIGGIVVILFIVELYDKLADKQDPCEGKEW